jgi:sulfur carrier protein
MSHEMMTITVNGDALEVNKGITLAELLTEQSLDQGRFVTVVNDEISPKSSYEATLLKQGDVVDIMTPITGG